MANKYSMIRQHQPLRTPAGWSGQEKAFIVQLEEIFDDIYRKFGRLGMNDMDKKFRVTIDGKYDIISGIEINENGIEVSGSKYVNILSGGKLYVSATNFEIDSENKYLRSGNWEFSDEGMKYTFSQNQNFRIYKGSELDAHTGNPHPQYMKCGIRTNDNNDVSIIVPDVSGVLREFLFRPSGALVGSPPSVNFIAPWDIYDGIKYCVANTYGWETVGAEEIIANVIKYSGTKKVSSLIRFIDNTVDQYGNGVAIGDGGLVVVGAGESAQVVLDNAGVSGGTETLYLASDGGAYILTNVNGGYSSRKEFVFSSGGRLTVPNELYLGSQNMAEAVKDISRNGTTFTATRCNGQTFTFNQQDTNTWRGFRVKSYSTPYNVYANTFADITANDFGASTPSGYTPVAVSLFNPGNDKCWVSAINVHATGTTPMMTVHNPTGNNLTNHAYISILYLQN